MRQQAEQNIPEACLALGLLFLAHSGNESLCIRLDLRDMQGNYFKYSGKYMDYWGCGGDDASKISVYFFEKAASLGWLREQSSTHLPENQAPS